ncbi:MAG: DUF433 domain-containing protein [Deltaproteobacteria bacterium]|nr:DUF433 domain-containing protein [Deltaproteobacteria bacterium]
MANVLTLTETAALAGVSQKVIRHSLAQEVVKPARDRKTRRWRFTEADALFFKLRGAIPFPLELEAQRGLYELVVKRSRREMSGWRLIDDDTLELLMNVLQLRVDLRPLRAHVRRLVALLGEREKRIVSRRDTLGGEPVFAGTRVSVNRVGQLMLRGVPMKEMKNDFPRLKDDDFELARLLATMGPRPGRPSGRLPRLRFEWM